MYLCPLSVPGYSGQTYGTGWGGYVLIEVDDPDAFARYQAHHNQTCGAAVVVTFELLFDVDKAAEETHRRPAVTRPVPWGRPPPRQPGMLGWLSLADRGGANVERDVALSGP